MKIQEKDLTVIESQLVGKRICTTLTHEPTGVRVKVASSLDYGLGNIKRDAVVELSKYLSKQSQSFPLVELGISRVSEVSNESI